MKTGPTQTIDADGVIIDSGVTPDAAPDTALWVGKISISTIGCNPGEAKVRNEAVRLAEVIGQAEGVGVDVDAEGHEFVYLSGQFYARNLQSGSEFTSGKLYLPNSFQQTVIGMLNRMPTEAGSFVEVMLEISAIPARNPAGYTYHAQPLTPPQPNNPLTALRARADSQRLMLMQRRAQTMLSNH